jgi:glycosyltransferase involved in cell wall biosynthesis
MARIAIDGREISNSGAGKSRYIRELLMALLKQDDKNDYFIFTKNSLDFVLPKNAHNILLKKRFKSRYFWQRYALVEMKMDLFFSPTGYHPILFSTIPSVVTVHDLAIFLEPKAKPSWKGWLYEYIFIRFALKRAKAIIAVSNSTKNDLMNRFKVKKDRITVTYLAPYEKVVPNLKKPDLPTNFLLFVGTIEPRKNIETLIRAYVKLPIKVRQECPLLLIGKKGWNFQPVFDLLDYLNDPTIKWLNYIDNKDLPYYFSQATAFIYPSWYEGFGLPVVEAMSYGTPVITSNTSSLPEVVGQAGLMVDPRDEISLSNKMLEIINNKSLRQEMATLAKKQAENFSWDKTAKETLKVFEKVINENRRCSG